jgi:hypothetical protein
MQKKPREYNEYLSKFKREMAKVQKDEIKSNRYRLGKIIGKLNIFTESKDDDDKTEDYKVAKIKGSQYTRLKNNDDMYAIGDSDGKPITDFDFVYVSRNSLGENDKVIEVITKSGKNKYFVIDSETIED